MQMHTCNKVRQSIKQKSILSHNDILLHNDQVTRIRKKKTAYPISTQEFSKYFPMNCIHRFSDLCSSVFNVQRVFTRDLFIG